MVRALELGGSRLGGVERCLLGDHGGFGVGNLGILLLARGGELFDLLAHRTTRDGEFRAKVFDVQHEPVHVLLHVDGGGERHLEPRGFVFEFRLNLRDARPRRLRRRRGRRLGLARFANGSLGIGHGVARGLFAHLEFRAGVGQFGGETFRLLSRRLRCRLRRLRLRLFVGGARGERFLALLRILEARLGIAERLGRLLELRTKHRGGFAGGTILLRHLVAKRGDLRLQVGNLRLERRDVRRLGRQGARLGERPFLFREALFQPLGFGVELRRLVLGLHLQTELRGFRVAEFLLELGAIGIPPRALPFQRLVPLEPHLELRHLRA